MISNVNTSSLNPVYTQDNKSFILTQMIRKYTSIAAFPSQELEEELNLPDGLAWRPRGDLALPPRRGRGVLLRVGRVGHHRTHQQSHLSRGRRRGRSF